MNDVLEREQAVAGVPAERPAHESGRGWAGAARSAAAGVLGGRRRRMAIGLGALVVLVAVVLVAGSGGGGGGTDAVVAPSVAGSAGPSTPGAAGGEAAGGPAGVGGSAAGGGSASSGSAQSPSDSSRAAAGTNTAPSQGSATVPKSTPRVVRTGDMALTVRRGGFDAALDRLRGLATGLGGFVSGEKTLRSGNVPTGSLTLRVPAAAFDKLQDGVRGLGTVTSADSSSQDVTGDYVDLQARIDALKATRQTYLQLLSKATTIGDTLAVQQEITSVQTQIEQLDGQRQVLADQSDLATLSVQVAEQGAPVVEPSGPKHRNGFVSAAHRSWHRFARGLQAILAGLGTVVLVLLVVAVLVGLALVGRAQLRRRGAPRTPPPASDAAP